MRKTWASKVSTCKTWRGQATCAREQAATPQNSFGATLRPTAKHDLQQSPTGHGTAHTHLEAHEVEHAGGHVAQACLQHLLAQFNGVGQARAANEQRHCTVREQTCKFLAHLHAVGHGRARSAQHLQWGTAQGTARGAMALQIAASLHNKTN